jgi:hypothetical protein
MRTIRTVRRTAIVAAATADSADWALGSSCEPTANGAASSMTMNATEASRPRPPRRRITFEAYRRPRSEPTYRTYPGRVPKRSRTGQQFAHHPPRAPSEHRVFRPRRAGILGRSSTAPGIGNQEVGRLLEEGASFVP